MGIIRNLGGMQKGLLGGLILGILVVYLCLCVSAIGLVPLSPHLGPFGSVSTAVAVDLATSTDTPMPTEVSTSRPVVEPTATVEATSTPLPRPSPASSGTEPPATETETPTLEPTATPTEMAPAVVALVSDREQALVEVQPTAIPRVRPAVALKPAPAVAVAASPAPSPTPEWTWRGIEYERIPGAQTHNVFGVIAVRVVGVPDRKVFIREPTGGWETTLVTGKKPQYGDFSDDVGGLAPGTYNIKPMDIDNDISVHIDAGDFVLVEFALRPPANWTPEPPAQGQAPAAAPAATKVVVVAPTKAPAPAAPTAEMVPATAVPDWTWQGIEYQRIPGAQSHNVEGTLAVRVVGVPDRKVFVREPTGGWSATMVTGRKPEYGDFSDALGGLSAGTYVIKPVDIDNEITVHLDQGDFVLVEFALRPTHPLPAGSAPQPAAPVNVVQPTSQPALAPAPAAPASAGQALADWTWQGIEYQRILGAQSHNNTGAVAVRVVGVPDRNVFVSEISGGWSTTLVTGRKAQYGQFGDDIGGLSPGTYIIKPMDIDNQISVTLAQGDFVLVEFALRPAHVLTP